MLEFGKGGYFMKNWYQWFYLSLGFAIGGLLNYFEGKRISAAVIQVSITMILGFIQFFCEKQGKQGKKVFTYISIAAIVLLVIMLIYLVLSA